MFLPPPPGGITTVANGYSVILRIIKSLTLNLHNLIV